MIDDCNLTLFLLAHFPVEATMSYMVPVNLETLEIEPKVFQNNQLAESRLFFTDMPERVSTDYVGFATHRWNTKFQYTLPKEQLHRLVLEKDVVWAPHVATCSWVAITNEYHPGMHKYVKEASDVFHLSITKGKGVWANNFICHKRVYLEFKSFFMKVFRYFYAKYGFNMDFYTLDPSRNAAFFYERITVLYFSNHPTLTVKEVPRIRFI